MRSPASPLLVASVLLSLVVSSPARPGEGHVETLHRHDVAPTNLDTSLGGGVGGSMAVVGDRLVRSAGPRTSACPGCDVVVYRRDAEPGIGEGWRRETGLVALVPPDAGELVGFGAAIATGSTASGDWIFVSKSGVPASVHVFRLTETTAGPAWEHTQRLPLSDGLGGASLAFDGERLVVGAPFRDPSPGDGSGGSADIFTLVGDRFEGPESVSMPFQPWLVGSFGHTVAVDGDVVLLAAPSGGVSGMSNMGFVASFSRDADGAWIFEDLLASNQPMAQGLFGTDIAARNGLLAVVAPNESARMPEGGSSKGIVHLFRRSAGAWIPAGAIADSGGPGAGVQRVAMHGDLLVTGRPAYASGGLSGLVSVYRLSADAPPERAFRTGRTAEFGNEYSGSGARIAVGAAWIAFTRSQLSSEWAATVVRALPLENALGTCGEKGSVNGSAILEGTASDCDDDLIPDDCARDCDRDGVADACAVAFAEAASAPLGPSLGGITVSGPGVAVVLTRITAPPDSDGVVRGILADWRVATPSNSAAGLWTGAVGLYADPYGDGDPAYASLLGYWPIEWSLAGGAERIALPPTVVAKPGGSFFVGLVIERSFGVGLASAPLLGMVGAGPEGFVTWVATYAQGEFDPESPLPSGTQPWGETHPGLPNVFCAALFASPVDTDVDGTPDACACDGDLDGDGAVGPADLALLLGAWGTGSAGADLDGDGTVGPSDLAMLLGAWGACRGG